MQVVNPVQGSVSEPVGIKLHALIPSSRREGSEQLVAGVCGVFDEAAGLPKTREPALSIVRISPYFQGFWLGYARNVIQGTTSSTHFLMKPVTDSVDG
jgi:hypothetical protein